MQAPTAVGATALTLRPPNLADEEVCLTAHSEFEAFPFLLLWNPGLTWARYLELLEGLRNGAHIPDGLVHSDFLLAEVQREIVGRVSIRFELNGALAQKGGHVGYGVRPAFRRRGMATEILRQSLTLLHGHDVSPVLVVCDDDNIASATVIERCGGVLESVHTPSDGGAPYRRYWIG
jgi:predicted acetyltransferase